MSKRPTLAPILRANFRPVAAVIASHPDLCLNGWKTPTTTDEYFVESRAALLAPEGQRQIETACAFLELVCTPRRRGAVWRSSYGLKHQAEAWGKATGRAPYVANGAMLVACLAAGLPGRRCYVKSPNSEFSVYVLMREMDRALLTLYGPSYFGYGSRRGYRS